MVVPSLPKELEVTTLNEFYKALDMSIIDSRKSGGGCTILISDPRYVFELGLEVLRHLISRERMMGVFVCLSRPYIYVQKAIDMYLKEEILPYFVDILMPVTGRLTRIQSKGDIKVFKVHSGPFDVYEIYNVVYDALRTVHDDFPKKEYFVYVDNLLALSPYVSVPDIIDLGKRFKQGFSDLAIHRYITLSKIDSNLYKRLYRLTKRRTSVLITTSEKRIFIM